MMDEDSDVDSIDQEQPSVQTMISSVIKVDFSYITASWIGRLKVMELLCTILAGCILPSVIGVFFTRFSFYVFVIWTSFMYIIIDLFVHVTGLTRLLPKNAMSGVVMYLLIIAAVTLLISCSLVAGVADYNPLKGHAMRTGCSAFFGYLLMVLFIVESVLRYRETKNPQGLPHGSNSHLDRQTRIEISGPIYKPSDPPPAYSGTTTNGGSGGGGMAQPIGGYA